METVAMRTRTSYTVTEVTKAVTLDPEEFRKCEPPFTGDTPQEFFDYIVDCMQYGAYDFVETNSDLSEETANKLYGFYDEPEWEVMFDSRNKSEEIVFELGEIDPEYRKYNGFNAQINNDNLY